jgi:threonine synthase
MGLNRAPRWNPALEGFECPECGRVVAPAAVVDEPVCGACHGPLVARYDRAGVRDSERRDRLDAHGRDLWRYGAMLPFRTPRPELRLGEGGTPLIPLPRLASALGVAELWLKDESPNATQSFKARGLAVATHGALALGRHALALPSAGNAGSAAAAYAAAAGIRCRIAIPEDTPEPFVLEQRALGAEVRRVPGTISDAARALAAWAPPPEWWNVATFREPFRLEGKKTLGYEIAEQLDWRWPEVIFYPTGGGTGLVGMWRAFDELRSLGWVTAPPPRLVSVQAVGCAPVVRAFERGDRRTEPWEAAVTVASGLRVPSPFAGALILRALRDTGGSAVAVTEDEMLDGMIELTRYAGCFACPEGGATLAALRAMRETGAVAAGARVVIYNTGSGLKYPEAWRVALARTGGKEMGTA